MDEQKAEQPKRRRGKRQRTETTFISKADLADAFNVGDIGTIDSWVREGILPPPHSYLGERYSVRLRAHWDEYVKTRRWPRAAWYSDVRKA